MGIQERVVCLELVIERLGAVGVAVRLEGGDDVLRARRSAGSVRGARRDWQHAATRLQQVGALNLAAKVVVQPSEMHCAAWIAAWIEVNPFKLRACKGDTRRWAVGPP